MAVNDENNKSSIDLLVEQSIKVKEKALKLKQKWRGDNDDHTRNY